MKMLPLKLNQYRPSEALVEQLTNLAAAIEAKYPKVSLAITNAGRVEDLGRNEGRPYACLHVPEDLRPIDVLYILDMFRAKGLLDGPRELSDVDLQENDWPWGYP